MQVLATLFAEILDFFRIGLFRGEADAGAVLPGIAKLALYEVTGHLVSDLDSEDAFVFDGIFEAIFRVRVEGWWSWILVMTTDATHGFIVILDTVDGGNHVVQFNFRLFIAFFVLATCASASRYRVVVGNGVEVLGGF